MRTHLPQVLQAGLCDAPGAGAADAQHTVPEQQQCQSQQAAHHIGQRSAQCRTRHAPAEAEHGDAVPGQQDGAGGVDEDIVEDGIQNAGEHTDQTGGQRVTGGTQHGRVGAHGHGKGQGSRPDGKIGRGIRLQGRVGPQPAGQIPADADAESGRCQTDEQIEQHGLPQHAPGILLPVGTQILCHLNGKRHIQPGQHAVQQPGAGADDADGCGGRSSDMAHHGGVDVFHGRDHDLLQDGRDAQCQHDLRGLPQRHLLALPHFGRELFKGNGHGSSFKVRIADDESNHLL